ncbi:MAG: hypothetical protein AAF567_02350 [Actinomycetota bacterium]
MVKSIPVLLAAVLVAGLAIGSLSPASEAQQSQVTCPQGTTLAADGVTCLSPAVDDNVTTTTSCVQGVLSADGTQCIVPRLDAAPATPSGGPSGGAVQAPVPTFTG